MAKGYWIGRIDVQDIDTYKTYVAANAAPFAELWRGGFLCAAARLNPSKATPARAMSLSNFPLTRRRSTATILRVIRPRKPFATR